MSQIIPFAERARAIVSAAVAIPLLLSGQLLLAQAGTWTTKAAMSGPRQALATGVIDGILYVAGGVDSSGFLTRLEAYDAKTNTWTTKAPMPTRRCCMAAAVVEGRLYVIGGHVSVGVTNALPTVEAYDPKTDTWSTKAPIPTPRTAAAAAAVDGIIFVVGGNLNAAFQDPAPSVEAYNPKTNTWSTKAPIPTPRSSLAAAAVDGVVYAVGGRALGDPDNILEAYDPKTNTWSTKAPMPTPRPNLAAAGVEGILYAAGGSREGPPSTRQLSTVEAYDPKTNTWGSVPPLPTPRFGLGLAAIENTLYAIGGLRVAEDTSNVLLAVNEAFVVVRHQPPPPPLPRLEALSPSSAVAGGAGFTLTARGANFIDGSVVLWNGNQRATTFVSSTQLQAAIPGEDIRIPLQVQVTVWTPGRGYSNALLFTITAPPAPPGPVINAGGVRHAAFGHQPPVAGGIASLFGTNLAPAAALASRLPLPTTLEGVTVRLNGIAAPLFSVSPTQINFHLRWELLGQAQATVTVTVDGMTSAPQTIALATYGPGIFTTNQSGSGQGAILIANSGALAATAGMFAGSRPAQRGEWVSIYCTGLGPVTNPPAAGAAAGNPLSATTTLPVVTIGGVAAAVGFAGLAPGWVGLYQVDAEVPAGAPVGSAVPVALSIGGVASNTVTIAVQ